MTPEKILENIRFTYKTHENQNDLFTPEHVKYRCQVTYSGKQYTFNYQCNPSFSLPGKEECLSCLFSDASCYTCSADVDDFLRELGYDSDLGSIRRGEKAYKACKRTADALRRLFTAEEHDLLATYLSENY